MTLAARAPATETPLLLSVATELAAARVRYCQWKGHFKSARWMVGDGDVDLLVDPDSLADLLHILQRNGFRQTVGPEDYKLYGTAHWRALDASTGAVVHLHVHTRLLIESARGFVYRLPLEPALLATSRAGKGVFHTPAPELEAVVLVLRTTVRWASWRRVPAETRKELAYLEGLCGSDGERILDALVRHLPIIEPALFERCRRALDPGATLWDRWSARAALTRALAALSRPPTLRERLRHAFAAAAWHLRGGPRPDSLARLPGGGRVIALVGADGAGKSTCARELTRWLLPHVEVRAFHLGRAPRSFLTLLAGAALKVAPWSRTLRLLRHLVSARDRWLLAREVQAAALDGVVCIVERFPIALNRQLVGPQIAELFDGNPPPGLPQRMANAEARYYRRIPAPDVVIALQVAPDEAVRRKTDEPADYVRARANIVWAVNWEGSGVRVVDAGRPLAAVLAELRQVIWETL
jgi:thymidylate kinase